MAEPCTLILFTILRIPGPSLADDGNAGVVGSPLAHCYQTLKGHAATPYRSGRVEYSVRGPGRAMIQRLYLGRCRARNPRTRTTEVFIKANASDSEAQR